MGLNNEVYEEFNYAISKMVYDIKYLSGGVLPKINLIGHSRGGITNLQYTLDHPDLVESVFSLGTPYFGSTTASLDYAIGGPLGGGPGTGEEDILNSDRYLEYRNRWNTNFDSLYQNIKVHAIGGYTTLLYLAQCMGSDPSKSMFGEMGSVGIQAAIALLYGLEVYLNLSPKALLRHEITGIVADIIKLLNLDLWIVDDLVEIIYSEINVDTVFPFVSWYNDGFVHLTSQLGENGGTIISGDGYKGFIRKQKRFTEYNSNFNKVTQWAPSIIHNLEAQDTELISYIISEINMSGKKDLSFETYDVTANEIGIRSYIKKTDSSVLVIPSMIDGKTVVEIGPSAFASNFNGNNSITTVVIPNAIKKIHDSAFSDCEFLEEVQFSPNSQLHTILNGVFANCINLNNIVLPNSLTYMYSSVFQNCTSLNEINIPNNLTSIGYYAFVGSGIDNITLDSSHQFFTYENKTLYDKNKKELIYSKASGNYTVPVTVETIREYAFYKNPLITSINLSNVSKIEDYAFAECNNLLSVIGGSNIRYVNKEALLGTIWFNNNYDSLIILGSVLVHYGGYDTEFTIPNIVKDIGNNAFDSIDLVKVYIPSNVIGISNGAFLSCENLQEVYILNVVPPIVYNSTFPNLENLKIYVPQLKLNEYKNSIYFRNYINNITTKKVQVNLYYEDGRLYQTVFIDYYSSLMNFPTLSKPQYLFMGWYCENNSKLYYDGRIFDILDDSVNLIVKFERAYEIYLNFDDVYLNSYNIIYGELKQFDVPSKDGFDFEGWFDNDGKQYTGSDGFSLFGWDKTTDGVILYAHFTPKEYTITYQLNGGTNSLLNPNKYTPDSRVILQNPTKYGYVFEGWFIDNVKTSEIEVGTFGNITLSARWIGNVRNCNENTIELYLNERVEIIYLNTLSTSKEVHIVVQSNVTQVTFISSYPSRVYNMYIEVLNRFDALQINFTNVKFIAPLGHDGINANQGSYSITINFMGVNSITGGEGGQDINRNGIQGYNGISAYRLFITGDNATITGGKGGHGDNGENGISGRDGANPPSGSIFGPIDGDPGEDGTDGTNGTNGANGGYAIHTISTLSVSVSNYTLIGGSGGNGGNSGAGGNGGDGASDTSGDIFTGVGEPGDGGDGGNGGNGGNAGSGQYATNKSSYNSMKGENGIPGNGGDGGYGGAGGDAGANGEDGVDGIVGTDGEDGIIEQLYHAELNCTTDYLDENIFIESGKYIFYEINIECAGYYYIETVSQVGSIIELYNENMQLTSYGYSIINNGLDMAIRYTYDEGTYYVKVINKNSAISGNIKIVLSSRIETTRDIRKGQTVNVLEHLHDHQNEFRFINTTSGFFNFILTAYKDGQIVYPKGTIIITDNFGAIQDKCEYMGDYSNAISMENVNSLTIYALANKTYNIHITFDDDNLTDLFLSCESIGEFTLDVNDKYDNTEPLIAGDKVQLLNIDRKGRYEFVIEYEGTQSSNIFFVILQKNYDNSLTLLAINALNLYHTLETNRLDIEAGTELYIGYFNGLGNGNINLTINRLVISTFSLQTDYSRYAPTGTEVALNGGAYGGLTITQGYTRICYLGDDAPNKLSRLNYEWFSTDTSIATVSPYGTITAISPGVVTIQVVYKELNTVIGYITITVLETADTSPVYLQYGMDVREGGTRSGTEVTSGLGGEIPVSVNPFVKIHLGKTRLICLGADSPTASIQDFIWSSSNVNVASVSTFGTVKGVSAGYVKITGVYKYNSRFMVEIWITVE